MSQKTSAFELPDCRLEHQVAESIDEDTDLLTVVREFDLSTAEVYETKWNARYDYEPMVRAFYCKELVGFMTEEFHEYLADAERTGPYARVRSRPIRCGQDRTRTDHARSRPDAEFLVDDMGYLTALAKTDLIGDLNYSDRNIVEKLFQTYTMRVGRFHETWNGGQLSTERWLTAYTHYYNHLRGHQALDDRPPAERLEDSI